MPALTKIEATLVVLPVFLYCCFLRSLRKLLPVSFLANIAILIGYFLVMRVAIVDVADHGPNPSGLEDTVRTSSLPLFFGLVTSSYEGIGLILPVEGAGSTSNWRAAEHHAHRSRLLLPSCVCSASGSIKKGRQHFTLLLSLAIVIVSCILGSFGLLGFLTYGARAGRAVAIAVHRVSQTYLTGACCGGTAVSCVCEQATRRAASSC